MVRDAIGEAEKRKDKNKGPLKYDDIPYFNRPYDFNRLRKRLAIPKGYQRQVSVALAIGARDV